MTPKELKRLSRGDLLEMLLDLSKENEQLRKENLDLRKQIVDRTLVIENSGSLAEAAMHLNGVFEAAQKACDQYRMNIMQISDDLERKTREDCESMLAQAREEAQRILASAGMGKAPETGNGDSQ